MLEIRFTEDEFQGLLGKLDVAYNEKQISMLRAFYVDGVHRKDMGKCGHPDR